MPPKTDQEINDEAWDLYIYQETVDNQTEPSAAAGNKRKASSPSVPDQGAKRQGTEQRSATPGKSVENPIQIEGSASSSAAASYKGKGPAAPAKSSQQSQREGLTDKELEVQQTQEAMKASKRAHESGLDPSQGRAESSKQTQLEGQSLPEYPTALYKQREKELKEEARREEAEKAEKRKYFGEIARQNEKRDLQKMQGIERQKQERQEMERQEMERQEMERQEMARQEQERQEMERQEQERQEKARQQKKQKDTDDFKKYFGNKNPYA